MRNGATLLGAALIATTMATSASATMRISDDVGGRIGAYVDQYSEVRNSGERVVIDGACLSACTLVLGIVPRNKVCVTPRASLGFHEAYVVQNWPFQGKLASASGTRDLMSYYPEPVLDWIERKGGLTPKMKIVKNGPDLWAMLLPCPEEW